jgi:hypothetical protein
MEKRSFWHFHFERCTLPPTSTKAKHPSSQTEKFFSSCDTTTHSPQQHYLFYGSFFFSKLVLASVLAGRNGFLRLSRTEDVMKREWELVDDSVNSPRQFIGHDCGVFVITNITFLAQKIPSTAQTYTEAIFLEQNTRERMHFSSGLPPVKKIVPPSPDYTTKTDEAGNCRSIDVQPAKRGKQSIFNIHHNKICVLCT